MRAVWVAIAIGWMPLAASAVDGVIEINQTKALAGGVTACDTPGFPVTICNRGSYRLTSELAYDSAASDGIVIEADYVSIDFNGMSLVGTNSCSNAIGGWVGSCAQTGLGRGINSFRKGVVVTNGRVLNAGAEGVRLSGQGADLRDFRVSGSGGTGVAVGVQAVVSNLSVSGNLAWGLACGAESDVSRVTATGNGGFGVNLFNLSIGSQIVAGNNSLTGIVADAGTQLSHFSSTKNGGSGVSLNDGAIASFGAVRDNARATGSTACGIQLAGGAGYHGTVVTAIAGGNAATVCGSGVNLGHNTCQGGPCPP
jgi:hypothetical protein